MSGSDKSEQARPVWLTREQVDAIDAAALNGQPALYSIVAAWDAAPADPAEAVRAAFQYLYPEMPMESETRAVLRALGSNT